MSDDIEYVKPKNPSPKTNPQDMDEKEREAFIKDYAEYLDILKQTQPEEYAKIVRELQEAAQGEFKAKLPGGKGYMGEKGIAQDEDYEKVTPEEAFVVKTNNMENNEKVFINICTHSKVGMFSKKKQLDAEGNEQEGLNIPLSLGTEHKEEDNKGNLCSTYDIIVNPEVVIESSKDISFKHFVVDLSIGYVEQKYKLTLNHQYKLPKLKYKGKEIQSQYIRKKKNVVIEEVDENINNNNNNKSKSLNSSSSSLSSTKTTTTTKSKPIQQIPVATVLEDLKYTIHYYKDTEQMLVEDLKQCDYQDEYNIENIPDYFILEFQLIPSIKLKDINLKYNLTSIVINIRNYKKCEVNIPYVLLYNYTKDDEKKHKLFFNSASHQFTGKFYIDTEYYTNFDSIDIGSKEWILQQALGDENDKSESNISKEIKEMSKNNQIEEVANDVDQDTPYNGEALPEDKFHKTDLLSQHYNQERDAGVQRQKEKSNRPLIQEDDEEIKNLQPIPIDVPIEFSNDLSDMIL